MPDEAPNADQRRELEKQRERLDHDDLVWLMSDARGRRYVRRLLDWSGVYRLSFAGESTHSTAFNEGARNIGNRVLLEVSQHTPKLYALMINEQAEESDG